MCSIDFHSGLLSKGPEERADGDRDDSFGGTGRGGTHETTKGGIPCPVGVSRRRQKP